MKNLSRAPMKTCARLSRLCFLFLSLTWLSLASAQVEDIHTQAEKIMGEEYKLKLGQLERFIEEENNQSALSLAIELINSIKLKLGDMHPWLYAHLCWAGDIQMNMGNTEQAEKYYNEALSLLKPSNTQFDHHGLINCLEKLGWRYLSLKNYALASKLFYRSLSIKEGLFGTEHLELTNTLERLIEIKLEQKSYSEALELCKRIFKIYKGSSPPASTFHLLAAVYTRLGEYQKAEDSLTKKIAIIKSSLQEDHLTKEQLEIASSLRLLAWLNTQQYRHDEAVMHYEAALEIIQQHSGSSMIELKILIDLADYHNWLGSYKKGLFLYERAFEVIEKMSLDNPILVCQLHCKQGYSYRFLRQYDKAVESFSASLNIGLAETGGDDPSILPMLVGLAGVYKEQGKLVEAEKLLRRSLKVEKDPLEEDQSWNAIILTNLSLVLKYSEAYIMAKSALDNCEKESLLEAECKHNLAFLCMEICNYQLAECLLTEAIEIKKQFYGPKHVSNLSSWHLLGVLYLNQFRYKEAERIFRMVSIYAEDAGDDYWITKSKMSLVRIYERNGQYNEAIKEANALIKSLKESTIDDLQKKAYLLTVIGEVYTEKRLDGQAEDHLLKAITIYKEASGHNARESIANVEYCLGRLYFLQGRYREAVSVFQRSLSRLQNHRDSAFVSSWLSVAEYKNGSAQKAFDHAKESFILHSKVIDDYFGMMSGEERLTYYSSIKMVSPLDIITSLAIEMGTQTSDASLLAWEMLLKRKGIVLDTIQEDHLALKGNPEADKLYSELRDVRSNLANLQLQATDPKTYEKTDDQRRKIEQLREQKRNTEQDLARLSARFREQYRVFTVSPEEIANSLSPESALIEFLYFTPLSRNTEENEHSTETPQYVAFVLRAGELQPVFISLGNANDIDALIGALRKKLNGEKDVTAELTELYHRIWTPLEKYLKGERRVVISPDGSLNNLSFATLLNEDGEFLIEKYSIGYVSSGRDLARRIDRKSSGAELFGNPDFGTEHSAVSGENIYLTRDGSVQSVLADRERSQLGSFKFLPLPGTEREVSKVADFLQSKGKNVEVWLGADATETRLKKLSNIAILHLATHGFFLPEAEAQNEAPLLDLESGRMMSVASRMPVVRVNPMHRSGFLLAGAKKSLDSEQEPVKDDGIVTAEEVSSLDLWGTEIVVLSACDTAIGEMIPGEGLLGLRRAFVQAGAKNLMLSLWKIKDDTTADIMIDFYREYLKNGDAVEAITQVQRSMINKSRTNHANYALKDWGAFVVSFQGVTE